MSQGPKEFEVAIICALPFEADANLRLFDECWDDKEQSPGIICDSNCYSYGRVGRHNAVLVLLPGVGKGDEILQGDVVIANSVVQYDFGRQWPDKFLPKTSVQDSLGRLSKGLRSLPRGFETDHGRERLERRTAFFLERLQEKKLPRRSKHNYRHPGTLHDRLFEASYRHRHRGSLSCCSETNTCNAALPASCEEIGCDDSYLVPRAELNLKCNLESEDAAEAQKPSIHIGPVASGDAVMKSGQDRDRIARVTGALAFEMEGAGVWDELPCIIVKGVCDYADSHKDKKWQGFASATAAAAMKALLEALPGKDQYAKPWGLVLHNPGQASTPLSALQGAVLPSHFGLTSEQARALLGSWIPAQVTLAPVLVIDARGARLPFHLETINSKELFIAILKARFQDLGTSKIESGEWVLDDLATGQTLDLLRDWQSIIKV
ncbi:phosphorylase superfamily protein [Hirsutella rhossiliensis]|uniref:Phosphorylase superfamily domain-containing protein n=1 Tax=Hirsutella rhossiliensis TaxID=111463 RepID=A0A9P8SFI9_9HYPO|nr:phosphorylase superfamily domain-containing protein [Hirsutella rhossiliensis]KAH0959495.1 phosphorylase superfamily domain-containing protein [Hirsutella rhossiliensis]